jgi:S1-C subfamily serine protease
MFRRLVLIAFAVLLLMPAFSSSSAQVVYELYNEQGASAPCLGIGLGVFIVKRCVSAFEKAGFVRSKDIGSTGLTLGNEGATDGVVTAVAAGSPAALAGIAVGDVVLRVDDHPAAPTPADVLAQRGFGKRGDEIHLKIRREGAEQDLVFTHQPKEPPPPPKGEGMMTSERPIINWRGQFAPCMGFGPGAILAYSICDKLFAPYGFISMKEFSTPGFTFDPARPGGIVSAVDADSPAAKAGLKPGDEVVELNGKPLTGSAGDNAKMLLFGKIGQTHLVVFRHEKEEKKVTLTLAPKDPAQDKPEKPETPAT